MKEKISSEFLKEIGLPIKYSEKFWQSKINLAKKQIDKLNNLSIFNPCHWFYFFNNNKSFFIEQWTFILKEYEKVQILQRQIYEGNILIKKVKEYKKIQILQRQIYEESSLIKKLRNSLYPDTSDTTQTRG